MKASRVDLEGRCAAVLGALLLLASCGGNSALPTVAVGGTVSGLSGTLVLQNNAGDDLTIRADGAFTFATPQAAGSPYQVSVRTQPFWQNCSVSQGDGNASTTSREVGIVCSTAQARVSTLAGSGNPGTNNGSAGVASFNFPAGVVIRPDGTLLVSDSFSNLLRSVSPAGDVTTLAGGGPPGSVDGNGSAASFNTLIGLALAPTGDVYGTDFNGGHIRRITPTGGVSTFAGSGAFSSVDGNGTSATFKHPRAVALHASGELYVVESTGAVVRKITPGGDVSTLAGSGSQGFADGNGTAASFQSASGIAVDTAGNLYVADAANQRIRKITPAGAVSTLAGSSLAGIADGVGASASFAAPTGLAIDNDGNLYVADAGSSQLRMVTPAGVVSTLAGSPSVQGAQDGVGAAATFNYPTALVVGPDGTLYVADTNNHKIRQLSPVR